jgi:hypothetical protein
MSSKAIMTLLKKNRRSIAIQKKERGTPERVRERAKKGKPQVA